MQIDPVTTAPAVGADPNRLVCPNETHTRLWSKIVDTDDTLRADPRQTPQLPVWIAGAIYYVGLIAFAWQFGIAYRVLAVVPGGMAILGFLAVADAYNRWVKSHGPWFELDKSARTLHLFREKRSVSVDKVTMVLLVGDWAYLGGAREYVFEVSVLVADQSENVERLLVMQGRRFQAKRVCERLATFCGVPRGVYCRPT